LYQTQPDGQAVKYEHADCPLITCLKALRKPLRKQHSVAGDDYVAGKPAATDIPMEFEHLVFAADSEPCHSSEDIAAYLTMPFFHSRANFHENQIWLWLMCFCRRTVLMFVCLAFNGTSAQ
jgi:hypothetical protein